MNATILIVDDSKTDMMLIKNMLFDYNLLMAYDGMEAMDVIDNISNIDLMILDLNMPRMDGFEVLHTMQKRPISKRIPTLILTNMDEVENEVKGLNLGAVDYIRKPLNMQSVRKRVEIHMNLRRALRAVEEHNQELEERVYSRTRELVLTRDITNHALSISSSMIPGTADSVVTFTDITQKKILERRMTYRIKLEEAVYITSRLLIAQGQDAVQEVMRILGEAMGLDRVFIYRFRDNAIKMDNTYEWCNENIKPQKQYFQDVDTSRFPWLVQMIKTGQPYAIADAQDIPSEASDEWLTIKSWGVRSMLCVPICNPAGEVIGFIGFMTFSQTQPWLSEDSTAMRIVAEMLGLYWERRKADNMRMRYSLIFEKARDIILLMQADGLIIDANLQALSTYGYAMEELALFSPIDLRPPELRPASLPLPDESNLEGILYETVHCHKDGTAFPVEVRSQGMKINERHYILSIIRDISERKKIEESVISLSRALDSASNAIILTQPNGMNMIYQNEAFNNLFGYTLEELNQAGGFPVLLVEKAFGQELYNKLQVGDAWQGELELYHKNGSIIQVLLYADRILNDVGMVLGLFGIISDIRERKMSELALATEKERLAVTLHSIGDGVIATDIEGTILVANPIAEEIGGWEQDEVIGQKLPDVLRLSIGPHYQTDLLADKHLDMILNSSNQTETLVQEALLLDREGNSRTVSLNSSPILDKGGGLIGHVLVIRDITDLIKAQMKMALSQKLESIGALAAGIAHEINSPLQYIGDNTAFFQESTAMLIRLQQCYEELVVAVEKGETNLSGFIQKIREMEQEFELDYLLEEVPRALEQTMEGIGRVRKLVLAMKEFSHPGTKEKKLSDLNKGIEATIAISRNEWKYVAELKTDLDPNVSLVDCVIDEINQVVLNIIVNAAHAIGDVIEQGGYKQGLIRISTCMVDDYAEISIQDNGTGIPKSIIAKIYDPFYTTKPVGRGTGQGLAIVHDIIVNKHHGTIDVYSEEGQGTTFVIRLPASGQQNYQGDSL